MNTTLNNLDFPLELKKRILEIMHQNKCSLLEAESKLICELLNEIRSK